LFVAIPEVYLTIDGIEHVLDYMFGKYHLKHDRNMHTKIKTNPRNLQNMIETYKLTQNKYQVYGRFNVTLRNITS
jgi:hypothetical protein